MIGGKPIRSRVAFVCTDPGIPIFGSKGAAVHAQSVLKVLVDAGHDVHVITPRPGPFARHPLAEAVTVHPLPAIGSGPAAVRERAAQSADRSGATVLDEVRPDLVYERYALWGRTATTWARSHRVPSILEVNAPLIIEQVAYRELADLGAAEQVARDAFDAADVICCVSDGVADWVRNLADGPDRIMVLPNGVDIDRVRPADRVAAATSGQPFIVGFLGTLKAWHGVDVLIKAMTELDRDPCAQGDWRLLVVGDGPLREELELSAVREGLAAEFTGSVSPAAVGAQLQRMDIGCAPYPNSGDHYFSPLKLYEYLAAGLPIAASAIGQIPDILDHGLLGRLVAPGDHRALAAALSGLRADWDGRIRLAAAAREAAVSRHTWAEVVERATAAAGLQLLPAARVGAPR